MAYVYWIHIEEHKDFLSEGYVGVTTKNPKERFSGHLSYAKNGTYPLSHAINKYGDKIKITTLLEGSEDYCYLVEKSLRPEDRIGWNLIQGGSKPPSRLGYKHSEETKKIISTCSVKSSKSPAFIAAQLRKVGVKRSDEDIRRMREGNASRKPWRASIANKSVWVKADSIYQMWIEYPNHSEEKLRKLLNSPTRLENMINKFKNGWIPYLDIDWVEFKTKYTLIEQETNK